eukprot:1972392-Prymnesium_polylepis.1
MVVDTLWRHSVLLVLDEWCTGALSRVWHKVKTTQAAGHRGVVIPSGSKDGFTGEFQRIGARVLAFFPSGTLAFGHAAGWSDDS